MMFVNILLVLIATVLGSLLYRMGGSDTYNTKWRDVGVSLIACLLIGYFGGFHWTLIVCFGAMWGALSTYFKKKGEPVRWYNWLLCGFMYTLAFVPYIWSIGAWEGLVVRFLVLPIAVMMWSVLIGNAVLEELGRGALIVLTIPLMFLKRRKK